MPRDQAGHGEFELHAWVDESMRRATTRHSGLYLLAAVVTNLRSCEPVRDALRELVWATNGRLHWRDETTSRRAKIASAISDQDLAHIVVATPVDPRRQERARRKCMERLLYETPWSLTTRELAAQTLVTAGAISQRVARAERDGLVVRSSSDAGRRAVAVTLTDAGHRLVDQSVRALLAHEEGLLSDLSVQDRHALSELLSRISTSLRDG